VTLRRRIPGLTLVEHELRVPLVHDEPGRGEITVFARELVGDRPGAATFPFLVFLQGGPGSEAPRVASKPSDGSWVGRALREYRVLMLDQRGTGRSSPIGTLPGLTAAEQAEHLTHFRADAIVRDAELVREALAVDQWSVLGQSFGGFCVLTYLSRFPGSLREAFFTGGLPPVGRAVDDVYERTYRTVLDRNRRYYERYPEDRERVRELVRAEVTLPGGDRLTHTRLRHLGNMLGMSDGAEKLHHILELPPDSPAFRHDVAEATWFGRNPLYAVVHESCYADGCVTSWAAERLLPDVYGDDETLLTGEHIFRRLFADESELRPLREAAEILAEHPWPALYDAAQLADNAVPAAAAVYANDMYVDRELSEETARGVRGLEVWLTNEFEHNGLRQDGSRILDRLIALARG
jgi:pimeloyl-ACP methyl ester carboxylesterase